MSDGVFYLGSFLTVALLSSNIPSSNDKEITNENHLELHYVSLEVDTKD